MKNQYFGDFGDYQKFSLIKLLRDKGLFTIGVHWMKTHDDQTNDGKRTGYLLVPDQWRRFEPDIFDFLKQHAQSKDLQVFQSSELAAGLYFVDEFIDDFGKRDIAFGKVMKSPTINLVFLDPDNGIEVSSTNSGNLQKYLLWQEIKDIFNTGKSVLIYQHFPRQNRQQYIYKRLLEIKKLFSAPIFAIQVKHSVYFLISQPRHVQAMQRALNIYQNIWAELVNIKQRQLPRNVAVALR